MPGRRNILACRITPVGSSCRQSDEQGQGLQSFCERAKRIQSAVACERMGGLSRSPRARPRRTTLEPTRRRLAHRQIPARGQRADCGNSRRRDSVVMATRFLGPARKRAHMDRHRCRARDCAGPGVPASHVALNWLLAQPDVAAPIIGARTLEQLETNLGCLTWALDAGEVGHLDAASAPGMPYPYSFVAQVDSMHGRSSDATGTARR